MINIPKRKTKQNIDILIVLSYEKNIFVDMHMYEAEVS